MRFEILLVATIGFGCAVSSAQTPGGMVPGTVFQDSLSIGGEGPEMVVLPSGSFVMGSPDLTGSSRSVTEGPQRTVRLDYPLAVGRFEITWDEWELCVTDGGCDGSGPESRGGDNGWGKGRQPVIFVSWNDAQDYVSWLSSRTGQTYRLLSESEWEYAARAGSDGRYSWGYDDPTCEPGQPNTANYADCRFSRPERLYRSEPVGFSSPNAFGLFDMHGNVREWVEDCYFDNFSEYRGYAGKPADGSAWTIDPCSNRGVRGGAFDHPIEILESSYRSGTNPPSRRRALGFRVARTLLPDGVSEKSFEDGLSAYQSGDLTTAYQIWLPLAQSGDENAQNRIGLMYSRGEAVEQDQSVAERWYREASGKGLHEAQINLGRLLIATDREDEAFQLWARAGADGNAQAAEELSSRISAYIRNSAPREKPYLWANTLLATYREGCGRGRALVEQAGTSLSDDVEDLCTSVSYAIGQNAMESPLDCIKQSLNDLSDTELVLDIENVCDWPVSIFARATSETGALREFEATLTDRRFFGFLPRGQRWSVLVNACFNPEDVINDIDGQRGICRPK